MFEKDLYRAFKRTRLEYLIDLVPGFSVGSSEDDQLITLWMVFLIFLRFVIFLKHSSSILPPRTLSPCLCCLALLCTFLLYAKFPQGRACILHGKLH